MSLPTEATDKQKFWRSHIEAAKKFNGPNTEYCRLHGLSINQFKTYKGKLNFSQPRKKKEFSRVQVTHLESVKSSRSLPDPKWLAEFLKAWGI